MALVEYCSHQKISAMAIAPANKSAARTAASDLNQLAVRWVGLFSITGESSISSISQTEECRKQQNKARLVLLGTPPFRRRTYPALLAQVPTLNKCYSLGVMSTPTDRR